VSRIIRIVRVMQLLGHCCQKPVNACIGQRYQILQQPRLFRPLRLITMV
jgi:hypothetical protein